MEIGKSLTRVDAFGKVTGEAKYTDDLRSDTILVAKILHSTIANGVVKSIDASQALKIPGVVKVLTCFDVPDIQYPTPGHPWSVEAAHQDVCDRKLLATRVRIYGDDIAVVVAKDEIAAERALKAIRVEYEEYPPLTTPEMAMAEGATPIHKEHPDNILKHTAFQVVTPGADVKGVDEVFATPNTGRSTIPMIHRPCSTAIWKTPSRSHGWKTTGSSSFPRRRSPTSSGGSSGRRSAFRGAECGSSSRISAAASATSRKFSMNRSTRGSPPKSAAGPSKSS